MTPAPAAQSVTVLRAISVADRREGGHLRTVATLLAGGVAGFALLAGAESPLGLVLGALLAFASGWGWPGLFNFAVVNENRASPATVTGYTLTGAYTGSALGPLLFGLVVEQASDGVAWGSAALALASAATVLTARRLVLRDHPVAQGAAG